MIHRPIRCSICDAGQLLQQRRMATEVVQGIAALFPFHYSVCDTCGMEVGTEADNRFNVEMMKKLKRSLNIVTLEQVQFCSRKEAEAMPARHDWSVISITEPISAFGQAKLQPGWHYILRLEFHDIDQEEEPYQLMTPEMAYNIVTFVREMAQEARGILVHCNAGVSRSAAMAMWIAEEFDLPFIRGYQLHNRHVYRLLCEAARREVINDEILMKHAMHPAQDLMVRYEIDTDARQIQLHAKWIDTALLDWMLQATLTQQVVEPLSEYRIELDVAGQARYLLKRVTDRLGKDPTLVLVPLR